ncbi:heterokaryon incompatibility protein-domain-containing protein [Xylariaceae sp. FL0804]|nr:heterokaryon incompatibility protein-domain-containing protein [Xylariaceae sp. FL0804]
MWLLNVRTRELEEYFDDHIPRYGILSHTWGKDEVLFHDLKDPTHTSKLGYQKVDGCCRTAVDEHLDYVWIDTCCINKDSSAELSEAINSMFKWYQGAAECFVYLADVPALLDYNETLEEYFCNSRWFTRGWTLQELLAPSKLRFYDSGWNMLYHFFITGRPSMELITIHQIILQVTGIDLNAWTKADISQRLSWVAKRHTTRKEDIAYCLLGLLGVHMPVLYGEGEAAFQRLLGEVIKTSNHHGVLAAGYRQTVDHSRVGAPTTVFPVSPRQYGGCAAGFPTLATASILPPILPVIATPHTLPVSMPGAATRLMHFSMTNAGLHIELPLVPINASDQREPDPRGVMLALLDCRVPGRQNLLLAVPLLPSPNDGYGRVFERTPLNPPFPVPVELHRAASRRSIYVASGTPPLLPWVDLRPAQGLRDWRNNFTDRLRLDYDGLRARGFAIAAIYPPCRIYECLNNDLLWCTPSLGIVLILFSCPESGGSEVNGGGLENVAVWVQFPLPNPHYPAEALLATTSATTALELLLRQRRDSRADTAILEDQEDGFSWYSTVKFDTLRATYDWGSTTTVGELPDASGTRRENVFELNVTVDTSIPDLPLVSIT